MNLDRVSIGIKTILRDVHLCHALEGILKTMPEARIIVADDGEHSDEKDGIYADLVRDGHTVIWCPWDSGFGFKSNRIAEVLNTPFLIIGSDDFDFSPSYVREGIERLVLMADKYSQYDVFSGRVNDNPYCFNLEYQDNGTKVIEHRLNIPEHSDEPIACDLTINYGLIRKHVFEKVRWDDDQLIGSGEHGSLYVDIHRAGFKVCHVTDVKIREQKIRSSDRYRQLRARAYGTNRSCFEKRGIREYILGSGQVDYCA